MIERLITLQTAEDCQRLINLMPPHGVFYDFGLGVPFLAICKKPAVYNHFVSSDAQTLRRLRQTFRPNWGDEQGPNDGEFSFEESGELQEISCSDFVSPSGTLVLLTPERFLGAGCPTEYMGGSEFAADFERAIRHVQGSLAFIMIIAPQDSELVDRFDGWNSQPLSAVGAPSAPRYRCWFNFDPPIVLHDDRFLAIEQAARDRLDRKRDLWLQRLSGMSLIDQRIVASAMSELSPST